MPPRFVFPEVNEKNCGDKCTARERLRQQREREQTREKRKRAVIAGAVGVAVLAVAAAVGAVATQAGSVDSSAPVVAPSGTDGEDKLVIPVGKPGAPSTLTVYEDFRCPACAHFEETFRDTIRELVGKGQLRAEYRLATIIDDSVQGSGSLNAANAAACAQDTGKFVEYHDVLYRNQPPETEDAFADKEHLIDLAGRVDSLVTGSFRKCVRNGEHDGWARASHAAFGRSGYTGTPTVLLNGENVYSDQQDPLTPQKLRQRVEKAAKG